MEEIKIEITLNYVDSRNEILNVDETLFKIFKIKKKKSWCFDYLFFIVVQKCSGNNFVQNEIIKR